MSVQVTSLIKKYIFGYPYEIIVWEKNLHSDESAPLCSASTVILIIWVPYAWKIKRSPIHEILIRLVKAHSAHNQCSAGTDTRADE